MIASDRQDKCVNIQKCWEFYKMIIVLSQLYCQLKKRETWQTNPHCDSHLLTYLLTYSMVQSPSWEANWFAASQENPRISQNPKVHYRTHKRPPPVSLLGQPNPVYIPAPQLLEIHPNIIHPSTPRSPQWSPSLQTEGTATSLNMWIYESCPRTDTRQMPAEVDTSVELLRCPLC